MPNPDADARRDILARVPLFAGLGPPALEALAKVAYVKKLPARQELFHKGDEGSQVYVVVSGRLRVVTTSAEGDDQQFNIMNPGEVVGDVALLAGGVRTATVSAIEDSELLGLDRRDFFSALRSHPDLAIHLLKVLAERLRRASELLEDTVFLRARARLAKKLLALADSYGRPAPGGVRIDLSVSQGELGTMVGTTRETVAKEMMRWKRRGILSSEGTYHTILKRRELEAEALTELVGS